MFFCSPCNGTKEQRRKNAVEDVYHDEDSMTEGMSSESSSIDTCPYEEIIDALSSNSDDGPSEDMTVVLRIEDMNETNLVIQLEESLQAVTNRGIQSLEIRGCHVCLRGAHVIREILQSSDTLYDFTFCLNQISENSLCVIAQGIRLNSTLKILDLSSNSLNDISMTKICSAMAFHTCIERLCLDFNDFGHMGIEAIASMLSLNSRLRELQLFGNGIDSHGAKSLSTGLSQNTGLRRLILTFNQIGDEGASVLGESLILNTTLTSLAIAANNIHMAGWSALGRMLPSMKGLEYLDVGDIYDTREAEVLIKGLERNTQLVTLHMESPFFEENSPVESKLAFWLRFNRCGRSIMHTTIEPPLGVWPLAIGKASLRHRCPNGSPDVLYAMLRGRPDLLTIPETENAGDA